MIEGWLFFSLLASLLFFFFFLFDKYFVDKEVDDYVFGGSIYTLPLFLVMLAIGFFKSGLVFDSLPVLTGVLAGGLYTVILIFYLKGVSEEDVSRFVPVLSLNTVLIAVISALFLGENLGIPVYGGIFLTVAGAYFISLENPISSLEQFQSSKAVLLAVGVAFIQALRDIIIEVGSSQAPIWSLVFWMGMGGTILSTTILFTLKRNKIKQVKEHRDFILVGGMRSLGYLSFMVAISLGSVTLASATLKTNGMFVFLGATLLSLRNKMLHESKDRKIILQKFLASAMIVAGIVVMKLFSA